MNIICILKKKTFPPPPQNEVNERTVNKGLQDMVIGYTFHFTLYLEIIHYIIDIVYSLLNCEIRFRLKCSNFLSGMNHKFECVCIVSYGD